MMGRTAAALGIAAALVASGCGSSSRKGVDTVHSARPAAGSHTIAPAGAPFSFTVPAGWKAATVLRTRDASDQRHDVSVISLDRLDLISVFDIRASTALTPTSFDDGYRQQIESFGATISQPTRTTVAGRSALSYELSGLKAVEPGDPPAEARRIAVFDGNAVILISCQWTGEKLRSQVVDGCGSVRSSMRLQ